MDSIQSDGETVEFYQALLDSLFDAVYTVDVQGTITLWNRSCERLTGLAAAEMIGQSWQVIPFGDRGPEAPQMQPAQRQLEFVLETGVPGTWKGWL
ncbi:MAG: PAS domain S-box protein, partial [Sedimentisphaerales bacterium]|nr:PAS domain S-box protein [Sedimentisphaerales bacterium]